MSEDSASEEGFATATDMFAANLRVLRAFHRLTLSEVAERAHMAASTIGQYERGEGNPRVTNIVRLARAYGVDPGTLLRPARLPPLPNHKEEDDET